MKMFKRVVYIIFILLLIVGVFMIIKTSLILNNSISNKLLSIFSGYNVVNLTYNNRDLLVYIADNYDKRTKGLSNIDFLPQDQGMLFVFEKPGKYKFWMKDMKFGLDFLWLDENKKIVYILTGISPKTYPKNFSAPVDVKYVIELNSGAVSKYGFKIGDKLNF